jgi:hypothetical protein
MYIQLQSISNYLHTYQHTPTNRISGTVFKTFVEILEQPRSIVSTLASTIPKNSAFYIQFIVVKMFSSLCTELLRIPVLAISALRSLVWGPPLTERERRTGYCGGCCWHASFPSPSNLTHKNAQNLLVFFIATTYSAIQPWILVAALAFFGLAYAVAVTDFTDASKQVYDSGGTFWPHAFWCMVASLMCGQLTLVGVITIKGGYGTFCVLGACCNLAFLFVCVCVCVYYLQVSVYLCGQYSIS